jgi:hypothetical protein
MKSPCLTPNIKAFLENPNLPDDWEAFRSAIAARMHLFPDAALPEDVVCEVVRYYAYYAYLAQQRHIERELQRGETDGKN